jgi:eukaryotic-like serine/threonine-protein kinase
MTGVSSGENPEEKSGGAPIVVEGAFRNTDSRPHAMSESQPNPQLFCTVPRLIERHEVIGRYEIMGVLGRGGMATVYLGRSTGEAGFSRLFAIKVLHPHLAEEEGFVKMLLDEARIAARLHHPNVVPIVDLGSQGNLHYVVMEYVEGCALYALLSKNRSSRPPRLIIPIVLDALCGLHAAHSLVDEDGNPMNLVHRDVSPQNILVGIDGTARLTDFGVARAESRINSTRPGQVKGKIAYMSPEQILAGEIDRRSDVFSAGGLLWSALTGQRLFLDTSDATTMANIMGMDVPPPSAVGFKPPAAIDEVCLRALERDKEKRWTTASDMEDALRDVAVKNGLLGSRREVAQWVAEAFGEELKARKAAVRALAGNLVERTSGSHVAVSGLRSIPKVGVASDEIEVDIESPPAPHSAAFPSQPSGQSVTQAWPVKSGRARVAALLAAGLAAGALGSWLIARSGSPPVAAPSPPVVPPAATAPPATPPPAVDPLPTTAESRPPSAPAPPPPAPPRVIYQTWRPPAPGAPHKASNQPSNLVDENAPSPPSAGDKAAPSKPTSWDKDSPLPPQ